MTLLGAVTPSEIESFFNLGDSYKPVGSIGSKGHGTKIYYKSEGVDVTTWKTGKKFVAHGVKAYGGYGGEPDETGEAKRGPTVNEYCDFAGVFGTGIFVTIGRFAAFMGPTAADRGASVTACIDNTRRMR